MPETKGQRNAGGTTKNATGTLPKKRRADAPPEGIAPFNVGRVGPPSGVGMPHHQQRRRRPPYPRHHFHWRTPWLRIFADEMLERALALRERQHRHERDEDFSDQVEAAELLFAGLDWGDDDCVDDDDLPPYGGDFEM